MDLPGAGCENNRGIHRGGWFRENMGRILSVLIILYISIPMVAIHFAGHRPNVLIITVDTLRADHIGSYGYAQARTPTIDGLAREGVRYSNAITAAPITLPSHTTILTGLLPPSHGVRDNGTFSLGDNAVTLAERLKKAGYTTQAFVSAIVLSRRYNLNKGFDGYDDDLWSEDEPKLFMIRERPAEKTVAKVLRWFNKWRSTPDRKPFFVWMHLFDPHQPYKPHAWAQLVTSTPYDAEITYADRELGKLLRALKESGQLDNTIVVFTADHGESLGEHGEKTHAIFIYDATVHVPLIIRYPSVFPKGKVYDGPVRNVDITPTILGLLGLPGASETQGIDLTPATLGKVPPPDLPQYSESLLSEVGFGMAPLYGVRKGGYKFIRAPRPELYDLRSDPRELHNLYAKSPLKASELEKELDRILDSSKNFSETARSNPMDRETLESLQGLGYLSSPAERKSMGGMDPKDGIAIYNKLDDARHLAQQSRWKESEAILRGILHGMPKNVSARNILALALLRQGRMDEARQEYVVSLRDDPTQARVCSMLGVLSLLSGDFKDAENQFNAALKIAPQFVEAMSNLGMIEFLRGNEEKAQDWYRKAIALDPNVPRVYRRVADIYYEKKDYKRALYYYRKGLEKLPNDFRALIQAGNSSRGTGDEKSARNYFELAGKLRPDSWVPPYNIACIYAADGSVDQALSFIRQAIANGLPSKQLIMNDPDLEKLRTNSELRKMELRITPEHEEYD